MANPNPKLENLKPFPKGNNANPNGRPKEKFSEAKELGFHKAEILNCYSLFIAKTIDELKAISNDNNSSLLEKLVISALFSDIKKGSMENLEKILNRAIGTPKQEITNTNLNVEVQEVTEEMQNELLNTLKRMIE